MVKTSECCHRLSVGDCVKVVARNDDFFGRSGVIVKDDESGIPFKVDFGDDNSWFSESELEQVESFLKPDYDTLLALFGNLLEKDMCPCPEDIASDVFGVHLDFKTMPVFTQRKE